MKRITTKQLTATEGVFNAQQLQILNKRTPKRFIYERRGKGGRNFKYVKASYVKTVLNYLFAYNWSFEVKHQEYNAQAKQCLVLGRLTCHINGVTIIKEQFGRADVKMLRSGAGLVDLGNDFKAAASDALKKCAAELGIARDVYSDEEFTEYEVIDEPTKPLLKRGSKEWNAALENKYELDDLKCEFIIEDEEVYELKLKEKKMLKP
jgi:hypothetical protein